MLCLAWNQIVLPLKFSRRVFEGEEMFDRMKWEIQDVFLVRKKEYQFVLFLFTSELTISAPKSFKGH